MRGTRIWALLLALALVLALLPCAAMAAGMNISGGLTRVDIGAGNYGPMELKNKHVYVINGDATFTGQEGTNELKRSGMFMFKDETAVIYVPKGVTLTVTGVDARETDVLDLGGAAGIYVPEGAHLVLIGNGTLNVTGGKAANGHPGANGGIDGSGGSGGTGGSGAGAGIGTNGATAGFGGRGGDAGGVRNAHGSSGMEGQYGNDPEPAGQTWDWWTNDSLVMNVRGGAAGQHGAPGKGSTGAYQHGGGGGGGGRGGHQGASFGTGGGGGGGGGGGAGGSILFSGDITTGEDGHANGRGGASINNSTHSYAMIRGGSPGGSYNWGDGYSNVLQGRLGGHDLLYTIETKIGGKSIDQREIQMERGKLTDDEYIGMLDVSKVTALNLPVGKVYEAEFKARDGKGQWRAAAKAGLGNTEGSWYADTYWADSGKAWMHPGSVTFELLEAALKNVVYKHSETLQTDAKINDAAGTYATKYVPGNRDALTVNGSGSIEPYVQNRKLPTDVEWSGSNPNDYVFVGWKLAGDTSGRIYTELTDELLAREGDITFVAVWEKQWTVEIINSTGLGTVEVYCNGTNIPNGDKVTNGSVLTLKFIPNTYYQALFHNRTEGTVDRTKSYYEVDISQGSGQMAEYPIYAGGNTIYASGNVKIHPKFELSPIKGYIRIGTNPDYEWTTNDSVDLTQEVYLNYSSDSHTENNGVSVGVGTSENYTGNPIKRSIYVLDLNRPNDIVGALEPGVTPVLQEGRYRVQVVFDFGTYSFEVSDGNTVIGSKTLTVYTPILIVDNTAPDITISGDGRTLKVSDKYALSSVSVTNGLTGKTVVYQEADISDKDFEIALTENGTYTVEATDKSGNTTTETGITLDKLVQIYDAQAQSYNNGTAKETIEAALPQNVSVLIQNEQGKNELRDLSVTWAPITGYDPGRTDEQKITVTGTITLPNGVVNPDHVLQTTSAEITVRKANELVSIGSVPGRTYSNGAEKSAIIAGLPAQVRITTIESGLTRNVTWDTSALNAYDPEKVEAQTFTLTGTVDVSGLVIPSGMGNTVSVTVTVEELKAYNPVLVELLSVIAPQPIVNVANGTLLADIVALLPGHVGIETTEGQSQTSVAWNTENTLYVQGKKDIQSFVIHGTAALPAGVENNRNVPLGVSISVTVLGEEETAAVITFVDVIEPDPITVPGGTAAADLPLPVQVEIETSIGRMMANVAWETVSGPVTGTTTITGTVKLPADVTHTGDEPEVQITVNVGTAADTYYVEVVPLEDIVGVLDDVSADNLKKYYLPDSVLIRTADGRTLRAQVVWNLENWQGSGESITITGDVMPVAGVTGMDHVTVTITLHKKSVLPTLIGVEEPEPVNVPNGTPLANIPLPNNLTVTTSDGQMQAEVVWDIAGVKDYDPSIKTEQRFTIGGVLAVPPTEQNPYGEPMMVRILVIVSLDPSISTGTVASGGVADLPQTGDASSLMLWGALLTVCSVGLMALRRRNAAKR